MADAFHCFSAAYAIAPEALKPYLQLRMAQTASDPKLRKASLRDAYLAACRTELRALKPGNVHDYAAGHGMSVADFEASAGASAPCLAVPGIGVGRDGCRTPMQWDATPNAGFSRVMPWLPLADDYARENVVRLDADARSILSLYKALIALRKQLPQLVTGAYQPVAAQGDVLLYRREGDGGAIVVALNLGAEPATITSSSIGFSREILLSTFLDRLGESVQGVLELRGNEGVIIGAPAAT